MDTVLFVAWRSLQIALAASLVLLFGHGLVVELFRRYRQPRMDRARATLYALLDAGGERPLAPAARGDMIAELRRLSHSMQEDLLLPIGRNLERSACLSLRDVATSVGVVGRASRLCRDRRWWHRLRGVRAHCALHSGADVVPGLLGDPHPAVRAQAAQWTAGNAFDGAVDALLAMIDDARVLPRFVARDALLTMGWAVTGPLADYLARPDTEDVEAALTVATAMPHPVFLPAAIVRCESPIAGVRARAIELLGAVGGAEGSVHVTKHLEDDDAAVRAAAALALGRMGHWPRATSIANRLRDPSWDVRKAAGLSLRALGSPGTLVLRRMTADHNNFAADMARQVLDLPPGVDEIVT